ncbi:MAG: hypothetical protein WCK29_04375, partial [archaeon]
NLGLKNLPRDCDKIAWIDCDLIFKNENWVAETSKLLEKYIILQLFSKSVRLLKGFNKLDITNPELNKRFEDERFGSIYSKINFDEKSKNYKNRHPGFAWAVRKEIFEEEGFYDKCILGSADELISDSIHKPIKKTLPECFSKKMISDQDRWKKKINSRLYESAYYVKGTILHLWHGERKNRNYAARHLILKKYNFDPNTDLKLDTNNHLWTLNNKNPELNKEIKEYFKLRDEEGILSENKKVNLLTQYYVDSSKERQKEIDYAIRKNCNNKFIDKIYLFMEKDHRLPILKNRKIEKIIIGERLEYQHCLNFSNKNLQNQLSIIANSDIYFDESINLINNLNFDNLLLAITRHDLINGKVLPLQKPIMHGRVLDPRPAQTQDAWIYEAPVRNITNAYIQLGVMHCERRFAALFDKERYEIINPYPLLRAIHVHTTQKRNTPYVPTRENFILVEHTNRLPWKEGSDMWKINKTLPQFPKKLPGSFWGISTFFNPTGYKNKYENYKLFREASKAQGLKLCVVELAFDDAPFELTKKDAEILIQIRGNKNNIMWQKEAMLNLGLKNLPRDCDKIAWIDCDIIFKNENWVAETSKLLEKYNVVQPFKYVLRMAKGRKNLSNNLIGKLAIGNEENEKIIGRAAFMKDIN